jgi:hypothetical protein
MNGFEDDLLSQGCLLSDCYRHPELCVVGFFVSETGRATSLFGLIEEKGWSTPVVVAQRDIFREISVHKHRDSI